MPNENNNAESIENFLIFHLGKDQVSPDKEKIETEAEKLRQLYPVSDEELTEIVKKVEAKLPHTMDEGMSLVDPEATHDENWYENEGAVEWNYWEDYKQYLKGESWTPKIISSMEHDTGKILGLLNNPQDEGDWDRRGLVIGDVQSGKTANYLGLVARAADAGYKFIVVIAGIHNNLRKQTQERVNEGFVGRDE
ncbi:MAG: endonuclease, partial [Nitrospina sp.]|nr:endonuclease [Nitrospina sp.]